jgi:hypothetical protein
VAVQKYDGWAAPAMADAQCHWPDVDMVEAKVPEHSAS